MPNYFHGINVTNKLNKFIRMYIPITCKDNRQNENARHKLISSLN